LHVLAMMLVLSTRLAPPSPHARWNGSFTYLKPQLLEMWHEFLRVAAVCHAAVGEDHNLGEGVVDDGTARGVMRIIRGSIQGRA